MKYKRFLSIIEYLWIYSSPYSPKTIEDIQTYLEMMDIEVGIKALRNDLQFLTSDESIIKVETNQNGRNQYKQYWIENRLFDIHELRYLMDGIASARFISEKETKQIIGKLKNLISVDEGQMLEEQLAYSSTKIESPDFSKTVQLINRGIIEKKVIYFKYGKFTVDKKFILSGDGTPKLYIIHPYGILWNEEKYYLIGFSEKENQIRHYRMDRIREIELTEQHFVVEPGFDLSKHRERLFNMYTGEDSTIEIIFNNELMNVVIDRFGLHADIKKIDEQHFRLITIGKISDGLVNWLLRWGANAKVIYPKKLVEVMKKEAERLYLLYHENNGVV